MADSPASEKTISDMPYRRERPAQECGARAKEIGLKPGGFLARFFGGFFDVLIFAFILFVLTALFIFVKIASDSGLFGLTIYDTYWTARFATFYGSIFLFFLYKPIMEFLYGATIGERFVGLGVIDGRGRMISLRAAFLRNLPVFLIFGPVLISSDYRIAQSSLRTYYLWILIFLVVDAAVTIMHPRKRSIGDIIAGTWCCERVGFFDRP